MPIFPMQNKFIKLCRITEDGFGGNIENTSEWSPLRHPDKSGLK